MACSVIVITFWIGHLISQRFDSIELYLIRAAVCFLGSYCAITRSHIRIPVFYEVIIGLFLAFRASPSLGRNCVGDPPVHTCLCSKRTVAEFPASVLLVLAFPVHRRRVLVPSDYRFIVVQL
jgi:hypothetical protein